MFVHQMADYLGRARRVAAMADPPPHAVRDLVTEGQAMSPPEDLPMLVALCQLFVAAGPIAYGRLRGVAMLMYEAKAIEGEDAAMLLLHTFGQMAEDEELLGRFKHVTRPAPRREFSARELKALGLENALLGETVQIVWTYTRP